MTDNEKIRLVKQMADDCLAYSTDKDLGDRAAVYIEAILTVSEFGGDDNAAD